MSWLEYYTSLLQWLVRWTIFKSLFVHCWTVASLAIHLNSAFQFKNHIFLFFGSNRLGIGLECVWYRGAEVKLTVDWTNRKRINFYFLFPFLAHIFLYHQGISYFFFSCPCKLVCFLSAMVKGVKSFWTVYLHIFPCNCSFILSYQLWKYWRRQGTKKITVIFIFKHPTYLRTDFDLSATIDKNLCILRLTCVTFSRKYRCKWLVRTEIKVKNKQANKQTNTNKQ